MIEIIAASGVGGLIEFAQTVVSPWQVGFALGVVGDPAVDADVLPTHLLGPEPRLERFAAGFIWGRLRAKGWDWVDKVDARDWSPEQKGVFLSRLPFSRETWVRADRLLAADQLAYWTRTSANPYEAEEGTLVLAAEQLLHYGRARAAIQSLERLVQEKKAIPIDLVTHALEANLASDEPIGSFDQYATIELIEWLQEKPDTPSAKLFQIEWTYLPWLGRYSGGSPKTLMRHLAHDASFFCEVIRAVFRAKSEEPSKEEPSEERKRIAESAYRLLSEWRLPPGSGEQGQFDEGAFKEWLAAVKQSTQESGHFEVAMSQFGEVLPYSPPDPNGLWIHKAVEDALNAKDADAMRSGFTCELFNLRGTHGFTAGKEEREIAEGYREKAEAVENSGYHRLATALRELAVSYERDAKRGPFGE